MSIMLTEVLRFLEKEHAGDIAAMAEFVKLSPRFAYKPDDPVMILHREREILIERLRALPVDTPLDTDRLDWLERHGCDQFSMDAMRHESLVWFDHLTDGSDYSPTLRAAIDAARKINP